MTTTTRPRTTKRAAAPRVRRSTANELAEAPSTVTELVDGVVEPVMFTRSQQPAPRRLVHLFSIDGDDFHVPAETPANVSLKFMRLYRQDRVEANGWLLETLLGEEAYTALMGYDELTNTDLRTLIEKITALTMGGVEEATRPLGRG